MAESLRDQQQRLARLRIIEAAAAEIAAVGLADCALPAVAERAGVSLRTVYNYYNDRTGLVDAVAAEGNSRLQRSGALGVEPDLLHLSTALAASWRTFDAMGAMGEALSQIAVERSARSSKHERGIASVALTSSLERSIRDLRPDLDDEHVVAIAALFDLVVGFEARHRLTKQFGLDADTSTLIATWATEMFREALARRNDPFTS